MNMAQKVVEYAEDYLNLECMHAIERHRGLLAWKSYFYTSSTQAE